MLIFDDLSSSCLVFSTWIELECVVFGQVVKLESLKLELESCARNLTWTFEIYSHGVRRKATDNR